MKRNRSRSIPLLAALVVAIAPTSDSASAQVTDIIFESGALGPSGVPLADLISGTVPGTNTDSGFIPGVRFHLNQPVQTTQVGGHFVARSGGTFFGAIVRLENEIDFPDSRDLSTPDVLGAALLTFPAPSAEVFGNLALSLDPGWYALVFGSGQFGAIGTGVAMGNNMDIGDPSYIGHGPNFGWQNLDRFPPQPVSFDNHRFVVKGQIVPEPGSAALTLLLLLPFAMGKTRINRYQRRLADSPRPA